MHGLGPCSAAGSCADDCTPRGALHPGGRSPSRNPPWEPDRMTNRPEIVFQPLSADLEPTVVVLAGDDVALGARAREIDQRAGGALSRRPRRRSSRGARSRRSRFSRRRGSAASIASSLLGTGKPGDLRRTTGCCSAARPAAAIGARKTKSASLIAEAPDSAGIKPDELAALLAFGAALRHYEFRKYLTKKTGDEDGNGEADGLQKLVVHCADPDKARAAFARYAAARQRHRHRARPRQRAGQRAGPRRIRRSRQGAGEPRASRSRSSTPSRSPS